ncbi:MAG: crossover junction endodeoxyribonuclease RuvC [Dehalococcoidia bacterium]|nr:crossover junction endodeoxyribonuclease RuvC [Dehalococcoidia bacterium]
MVTLGIDPGTAKMGYGLVREGPNGLCLVDYGVLTTPASQPLPRRLQVLYQGLMALIARHKPSYAAVEQLFFAKNARTAFVVGQARGVVLLAAANSDVPVSEYTPLHVKQAIADYGRGSKFQVQTMVKLLLNLDALPEPDDAADALAIAICHINTMKYTRMIGGQQ